MKALVRSPIAAIILAVAGCADRTYTPQQLDAIQTRPINAPSDVTFRATVGVMLDRGMRITLSDGDAGLVGAIVDGIGADGCAQCQAGGGPNVAEVIAWARPDGNGRSLLRIQFVRSGIVENSSDAAARFAEDVARRTLMSTQQTRKAP